MFRRRLAMLLAVSMMCTSMPMNSSADEGGVFVDVAEDIVEMNSVETEAGTISENITDEALHAPLIEDSAAAVSEGTAMLDGITDSGETAVSDSATDFGEAAVSDPATDSEGTAVSDPATDSGEAAVSDPATDSGEAAVSDPATDSGEAAVSDSATDSGEAAVSDPSIDSEGTTTSEGAGVSEDEMVLEQASIPEVETEEIILTDMSEGADSFAPEQSVNKDAASGITSEGEVEYVSMSDLPDSDELLAGYINELFYGPFKESMLSAADYTNELTGNDALVYSYVLTAVQEIAEGKRTSSVIDIPLSEFGGSIKYSAQDLGVSAIGETNSSGEWKITAEASNAMMKKLQFDHNAVLNKLCTSCPYHLYWYDKTAAASFSFSGLSASADNNGEWIWFSGDIAITISMPVSADYAVEGAEYTVDSQKTAGVSSDVAAAVANAKAKKEACANLSDIEKLYAYKEYITEMVSYDTDAAANENTPYGDPWQLVHVFDGKVDTNVVCEGYSKAFKYLCDISSFSKHVECLLVSGMMTGATGEGRHMWNLVVINGKSYLADITNSDTGTIGSDGGLFMAGSPGEQNNGYSVAGVTYTYNADTLATYSENPGVLIISEKNYSDEQTEAYTITLHSGQNGYFDGNATEKSVEVEVGSSCDLTAPTAVTGYRFTGYTENTDGSGTVVTCDTAYTPEKNVKLYAQYDMDYLTAKGLCSLLDFSNAKVKVTEETDDTYKTIEVFIPFRAAADKTLLDDTTCQLLYAGTDTGTMPENIYLPGTVQDTGISFSKRMNTLSFTGSSVLYNVTYLNIYKKYPYSNGYYIYPESNKEIEDSASTVKEDLGGISEVSVNCVYSEPKAIEVNELNSISSEGSGYNMFSFTAKEEGTYVFYLNKNPAPSFMMLPAGDTNENITGFSYSRPFKKELLAGDTYYFAIKGNASCSDVKFGVTDDTDTVNITSVNISGDSTVIRGSGKVRVTLNAEEDLSEFRKVTCSFSKDGSGQSDWSTEANVEQTFSQKAGSYTLQTITVCDQYGITHTFSQENLPDIDFSKCIFTAVTMSKWLQMQKDEGKTEITLQTLSAYGNDPLIIPEGLTVTVVNQATFSRGIANEVNGTLISNKSLYIYANQSADLVLGEHGSICSASTNIFITAADSSDTEFTDLIKKVKGISIGDKLYKSYSSSAYYWMGDVWKQPRSDGYPYYKDIPTLELGSKVTVESIPYINTSSSSYAEKTFWASYTPEESGYYAIDTSSWNDSSAYAYIESDDKYVLLNEYYGESSQLYIEKGEHICFMKKSYNAQYSFKIEKLSSEGLLLAKDIASKFDFNNMKLSVIVEDGIIHLSGELQVKDWDFEDLLWHATLHLVNDETGNCIVIDEDFDRDSGLLKYNEELSTTMFDESLTYRVDFLDLLIAPEESSDDTEKGSLIYINNNDMGAIHSSDIRCTNVSVEPAPEVTVPYTGKLIIEEGEWIEIPVGVSTRMQLHTAETGIYVLESSDRSDSCYIENNRLHNETDNTDVYVGKELEADKTYTFTVRSSNSQLSEDDKEKTVKVRMVMDRTVIELDPDSVSMDRDSVPGGGVIKIRMSADVTNGEIKSGDFILAPEGDSYGPSYSGVMESDGDSYVFSIAAPSVKSDITYTLIQFYLQDSFGVRFNFADFKKDNASILVRSFEDVIAESVSGDILVMDSIGINSYETLTIPEGVTVIVHEDVYLEYSAILDVKGTLTIQGNLTTLSNAKIAVNGQMSVAGDVDLRNSALTEINGTVTIHNLSQNYCPVHVPEISDDGVLIVTGLWCGDWDSSSLSLMESGKIKGSQLEGEDAPCIKPFLYSTTEGVDKDLAYVWDGIKWVSNSSEPEQEDPEITVTGVALDQSTLALKKGNSATLTATVSPSNATNKTFTWSSSNNNVATVDANGKVTAVGAGTTTITFTTEDGSKTATCTVTVTNPIVSVTKVVLNKTSLTLEQGKSENLTATVTPSNATNKAVTWISSNNNVAAVSNGKVTAKKAGTATITVKTVDGSKTARCTVTVDSNTQAFARRLYELCLNRNPDAAGLNNWVSDLTSGKITAADAVQGFFYSNEMNNLNLSDSEWVERCYQVMMGRGSDAGGKAGWVKVLQEQMKKDVLKGFIDSTEFTGICNSYGITKGTISDPDGLNGFIARCYNKVLRRDYDQAGLNSWVNIINNDASWGPTRKERAISVASRGFFESQEFLNRNTSNEVYVKTLYRTFLGREADTAGYTDWVNQMNSGKSRAEILKGFAYSAEFNNILNSYGIS